MNNEQQSTDIAIVETEHAITPAERILAPLELTDLQNVVEWVTAVLP